MLDGELIGRTPAERSHGEIVGVAVVDGELFCKVIQGAGAVAGIKAFLVLAVATLYLAVMTQCVGTGELMPDTKLGNSGLKQGGQITPAVGKTVGELKSIVSLDTLPPDTSTSILPEQLFQEIGGEIGGLLRVGCQEAQAVNSAMAVYWQRRSPRFAVQRLGTIYAST